MRTTRTVLLALAAVALLAGPALAQTLPFSGLRLTTGAVAGTQTEDDDPRIPYKGTGTIPVTVELGCVEIFQALPAAEVDVTMEQPTWLTVTPAVLSFGPQDCTDPTGFARKSGNITFNLKPEAPGVVPQTLEVTATAGSAKQTSNVTFAVGYHSEYTVVADKTFPLAVHGNQAVFNVTVTQKSNARSMVMFEDVKESAGKVSGLASVPYDNPPASKTFKVTYKGPPAQWSTANVTFTNFGHYLLDIKTGPFTDAKTTTWQFTNSEPVSESGSTNASPLNGWPLIVSILGAAVFAMRRRTA